VKCSWFGQFRYKLGTFGKFGWNLVSWCEIRLLWSV